MLLFGRISVQKTFLKKGITFAVIVLFIGMIVIPSTGRIPETVYTVSSDGNTLYVGGSGEGNYTKIQDAIDDASDRDTVFVYDDSSPYYENIIINISINLLGEDKNTTIIDGNKNDDVVYLISDSVRISDFTIINSSGSSEGSGAGIRICSNFNNITNNIISNNSCGIQIWADNYYNMFYGNIINYCWYGIIGALWNFDNQNILYNTISNIKRDGISFYSSDYINIIGNTIENCGLGINLNDCDFHNITENTISKNSLDGVFLTNCRNITIIRNKFSDHSDGISFYSTRYCIFTLNNLISSRIYLSDSIDNIFLKNNFIGCLFPVHFHSSYSTWNFNYWNRPRIFPKPIFGRERNPDPYDFRLKILVQFDWHPVLKPYDI